MSQETKILAGIGIITAALVIGAAFLIGGGSNQTQNLTPSQEQLLVRGDSNKISTPSAKLTIVEFGDFQCPACGQANPIVERILKDYKTKINFVFRNFAFLGQESNFAAQAAECAGEQGKYWEYHNFLYSHQNGENEGAFTKDKLKTFARTLDLAGAQFDLCLDSDKTLDKVLNDTSDGKALGVNSTPTFFFGTEKVPGVLSYENFKTRIDSKVK